MTTYCDFFLSFRSQAFSHIHQWNLCEIIIRAQVQLFLTAISAVNWCYECLNFSIGTSIKSFHREPCSREIHDMLISLQMRCAFWLLLHWNFEVLLHVGWNWSFNVLLKNAMNFYDSFNISIIFFHNKEWCVFVVMIINCSIVLFSSSSAGLEL